MIRRAVTNLLALVVLLSGGWLYAGPRPDLGVMLILAAALVLSERWVR